MEMDDRKYGRDVTGQELESAPSIPSLDLDPGRYLGEMDHFEMSEAQKVELLETLWSIMRSFVELGFTVDICGQLFGSESDVLPETAGAVDSRDIHPASAPESGDDGDVRE